MVLLLLRLALLRLVLVDELAQELVALQEHPLVLLLCGTRLGHVWDLAVGQCDGGVEGGGEGGVDLLAAEVLQVLVSQVDALLTRNGGRKLTVVFNLSRFFSGFKLIYMVIVALHLNVLQFNSAKKKSLTSVNFFPGLLGPRSLGRLMLRQRPSCLLPPSSSSHPP